MYYIHSSEYMSGTVKCWMDVGDVFIFFLNIDATLNKIETIT